MRTIKFRGRDVHTGEFVYSDGGVYYSAVGVLTNDGREVKPDSVAQLVGYDKDGAEVYEGDIVCDKHGIHYVVRLIPQVPVANMTVKEATT